MALEAGGARRLWNESFFSAPQLGGYSITRDAAGRIVRDAAQVELGDEIPIRLHRGEIGATFERKKI